MITICFDFKNREASDLQQLNALLATMKLKDLDLEDTQGYLSVTRDGDGNLLGKRYGLDSGTLVCKLAGSGRGFCYQIDTVVVDKAVDYDTYMDCWRESHPDRAMRTVITIEFASDFAYIIAHHQKA